MSFSRDELLRPSLAGTKIAKAPYSLQTAFLASFFGGPFAAIAITGLNSVRLQRWTRDLLPLAAALAAYLGFTLTLAWTAWGADFRSVLTGFGGDGAVTYLHRGLGLALFGIGYVLHRKEQRGAELMGMERPNGWVAGVACILVGLGLQVALATVIGREGQ